MNWKQIKSLAIATIFALLIPGLVSADALSEGRLSITESSGTITLNCKAPCKVALPSTTAGADVLLDISGNTYTYTDGGTGAAGSDMEDIGFGLTETVDWSFDRLLFHYLVNEDNTKENVGWFITLSPILDATPAAGLIHDKTAVAGTDSKDSIFGAWADDAGKAMKPCTLIGVTRVQFDTDGGIDAYITQTLLDYDGIGEDRLKKSFGTQLTMAPGQNGNASGAFFADNGGGAPIGTTQVLEYKQKPDGNILYSGFIAGGDLNGSGNVVLQANLPIAASAGSAFFGSGRGEIAAGGTLINLLPIISEAGVAYAVFSNPVASPALENVAFDQDGDEIYFTIEYNAFIN